MSRRSFAVGIAILLLLVIGPAFVVVSALRIGPFAAEPLAFPAALLPRSGAYLGAFAGPLDNQTPKDAILHLESEIGRKLAIDHQYYRWDEAIPTSQQEWDASTGRLPFVNWSAERRDGSAVMWSAIADGSQDDWIVERADAFKDYGFPIYLAFHHEPENDVGRLGTPEEYAAAFRHIVTVFRSRGVTNVAFVWTMMSWTFDTRSGRDAETYYPGDAYVDFIGVDGFNSYPGRAGAPWESFHDIFQSSNYFAALHNTPWMVVETGVQEDPAQPGRKGQWLRGIVGTAEGWPLLRAVLYFDTRKEFDWNLDSSVASTQAFTSVAHDPYLDPTPPGVRGPDQTLQNNLDLGPRETPILANQGEVGDAFDKVVTTAGSRLTYDDSHALGRFSAKHDVSADGNAYYQWTGLRSTWYGRLYVRLEHRPRGGLRLIRASTQNVLRCALDILPDGTLRWVDQSNRPIATTTKAIAFGRWVRIEWRVDHVTGQVTIILYDSAFSTSPTQSVSSRTHSDIGPSAREIAIGRSGTQPFPFTFRTDDPALSATGYLGP
jgi:hypothetical protein